MSRRAHQFKKRDRDEWECSRCGIRVAKSLVLSRDGRKAYSRYVVSVDGGATWRRTGPGPCSGVTTTKKEKK